MKKIKIEVCCGSVDDTLISERSRADRIELNASLFFGGLTPSIGAVIEAKNSLKTPVMIMIRPRGGGFCYTEPEIKTMEHDIEAVLNQQADGIVFGVLNKDGTIDIDTFDILLCLNRMLAVEIMPDHVHLFLSVKPNVAPSQIALYLKGWTSKVLREEFPYLKDHKAFWAPSYFVTSSGNISSETIRRYIEEAQHL
ncbi:MAG: IS200/IS605 family transposase [Candidatus Hermodarchaeota archaeon]